MAIRESVALDVSHLPTCAFGHRDPLWWGIILAIAIETTAFAIGWATYLYLRMQEATWPPWGWSTPNLLIGALSTIADPSVWCAQCICSTKSRRRMRRASCSDSC